MFNLKQVLAIVIVVFVLIGGATGESEGFNGLFDFLDDALGAVPEVLPIVSLGLLVGAGVDVLKAAKIKIKGKDATTGAPAVQEKILKFTFGPGMASILA